MLFSLSRLLSFLSLTSIVSAYTIQISEPEINIKYALAPPPQHLLDEAAAVYFSSNSSALAKRGNALVSLFSRQPFSSRS